MIDLHTHSTFSDGSCSPTELVQLAKNIGGRQLQGQIITLFQD